VKFATVSTYPNTQAAIIIGIRYK